MRSNKMRAGVALAMTGFALFESALPSFALKLKLKKAAAVQEQLRLDHEQAAEEAAALEAAVAKHGGTHA